MHSAKGRWRAASTCGSHLTAVAVLYRTLIFMNLRPSSSYTLDTDKMASVFYTLVIPALNPLIYSLRTKEVKEVFRRNCKHCCCPGPAHKQRSSPAMDAANETSEGTPFTLLGLTTNPGQQRPLFVLFLVLYVVGILGNGLIVAVI
eukprot:bmy_19133T0